MEELEKQIYNLIEEYNKKAEEQNALTRFAAVKFDQSQNGLDYFSTHAISNIEVTPSKFQNELETRSSYWYNSSYNC